jgi:hypothetical protein
MGVMAERSVGGTVDLDYAPSGVTWRLACPAVNALEAGNGWKRESGSGCVPVEVRPEDRVESQ